MGAIISRWKAKPSTVEVLEGIDKDIQVLDEYSEKYQKQLKTLVGRLLLYSCLVYLVTCVVVYFWYLPELLMGQLILSLPFIIFPLIIWLLRKMLIIIFTRRTEKNNNKLEDLKAQKRKILEEVMETETYKNAKLILERFDPDSKKKMEPESTPIGLHMTPKPGQGGPPERNLSAVAAQQSLMRKPVTPGTPVPGFGMHPPGPPLARPVLPRERRVVDRVIEYLVGDGPQNRFALICQQCVSHNGMALKEEFEYVAFRCAYCYFLNPARKTRPQAPRLPEAPGEVKLSSDAHSSSPHADEDDDLSASGKTKVADVSAETDTSEPISASDAQTTPESQEPPSEKTDGQQDLSAMEVE
ncbi:endoplasmic reticulum junction formation protein lunapark-A isoform X2 [Brachionichthys hirsutus]|uniref:endoplasmic reticulum junction formation protein lunapark-A isoform X2 n=1 Tax=Brachionichthys hirsutus TaxID=412623 RepID=UPI003604FA58